jgi:hypothetical protein
MLDEKSWIASAAPAVAILLARSRSHDSDTRPLLTAIRPDLPVLA